MDYKKNFSVTMKNPNLITNKNYDDNKGIYNADTLFSELENELRDENTTRISFAVSFIKQSGYILFATLIEEALKRDVNIEIITSVYMSITEPLILRKFLKLKKENKNFDFKVLFSKSNDGYHMKSYLFEKENSESVVVIGSSNISKAALKSNLEWNIRYVIKHSNKHYKEIDKNFREIWKSEHAKDIDEVWVGKYENHYHSKENKEKRVTNIFDPENNLENELYPREIQLLALEKMLDDHYNDNKKRGILSLATGVGKTHTSAWFIKALGSKRILFLTPRKEITKHAESVFNEVFSNSLYISNENTFSTLRKKDREKVIKNLALKNNSCRFGTLGGGQKLYGDSDFIFSVYDSARIKSSSESAFGKNETPTLLKKDFDVIIVDEAHHTTTKSIKEIINYFEEKNPNVFILGLTATPFRTINDETWDLKRFYSEEKEDNSYILFRWNLFEAIENNDLATLNYFGITAESLIFHKDEMKGNWESSDKTFRKYKASISAESLKKTLNTYLWSGEKLRCLVFCVNIKHAQDFTKQLNSISWKDSFVDYIEGSQIAECITSKSNDKTRENVIERLENPRDSLQFVVNVGVFSEGVDIPSINTVVFLRPTKSPLIFLQQLGRGLRKTSEKDSLTVFDFVRNDKNDIETIHRIINISSAKANYSSLTNVTKILNNGRSNFEFIFLNNEMQLRRLNINDPYYGFLKNSYNKTEVKRGINYLRSEKDLNDLVSIEDSLEDGNVRLIKLCENSKNLLSQVLELKPNIKLNKNSLVYRFFLECQSQKIGAFRMKSDLLIFIYICELKLCFKKISPGDLSLRFSNLQISVNDWRANIENFCKLFRYSDCLKMTEKNEIISNYPTTTIDDIEEWIITSNLKYFKHVSKKYYNLDLSQKDFNESLLLHRAYTRADIFFFHQGKRDPGPRQGILNSKKTNGCYIIATIDGKQYNNALTNDKDEIKWYAPTGVNRGWNDRDDMEPLWKKFETENINCDIFIKFSKKVYPKNLYWYLGKMDSWRIDKSSTKSLVYRIKLVEKIEENLYSFMKRILSSS